MVTFQDFRISGFQELGNLEIVTILKEREGYNLGDGNFSGFPEDRIFRNDGDTRNNWNDDVTRNFWNAQFFDASQNAQFEKSDFVKWPKTRVFPLLTFSGMFRK